MNLTKKTITVWDQPTKSDPPAFNQDWETFIARMIQEEKTDGVRVEISPESSIRYWLDAAAAQEYVAFTESFAQKWSVPVPTVVVEDNVQ